MNRELDTPLANVMPCCATEAPAELARDMDPELADKFIGMYVNRWTLGYGERGRAAVQELLDRGFQAGLLPGPVTPEFLDDKPE